MVVLSLVLLPAAPGVAASPKSGPWTGVEVQLGDDLKFTVKRGKIKKISARVLESCNGSVYSSWTTFAPDSSWKIKKGGRFSGRHKEKWGAVTVYYTFKGRFTSKRKAKGILRSESVITGSLCDTRNLKWKAKAGR